jgi:hypothetical protein
MQCPVLVIEYSQVVLGFAFDKETKDKKEDDGFFHFQVNRGHKQYQICQLGLHQFYPHGGLKLPGLAFLD